MTTNREYQLRTALIEHAQQLQSSGLSCGKSGNLSARHQDTVLITPSGVAYSALEPQDIVALNRDGTPLPEQPLQPSSEWRIHCDLYQQRPDISAIVHAHPTACTALACTGRGIPAFHYMVAVAGGSEIPLAGYALFGTEVLSENIVRTIGTLNACLLANHGMVALGDSVASAFNLALEIENLAAQYCQALQLGDIRLLNDAQMREVLQQFRHYGQRS